MNPVTLEGQEHLKGKACFLVPNQVNLNALIELEKALGKDRVTYLVEESFAPSVDVARYLQNKDSDGILFNFRRVDPISLRGSILEKIDQGRHVVFLPGRVAAIKGTMSHVPAPFLMHLSALHISPCLCMWATSATA